MAFEPKLTITNNLLRYIARIEACREVIHNSPIVPAWESKFQQDTVVRSVHYGTHLEGNDLSLEQTEKLMRLDGIDEPEQAVRIAGITAEFQDVQEVLNYREVQDWICSHAESGQVTGVYTEDTLAEIHQMVCKRIIPESQVATYRRQQVVVRAVDTGEIAFRPPAWADIPRLLSEFFFWLNSAAGRELHPVLRAGIAHYEIVRIHPFTEGNGRTARALMMLILYSEGFDVRRLFSLEEYFDKDADGYYKAILSVQKSAGSDLTYWLEYFSYGLALELDRVKEQVLKISHDMKLKSKLGAQVALSERQLIMLEILNTQGELTTTDAAKALPMISTDTILRDLKDLIRKGIIHKFGVTKGVVYKLNE